MSRSAGVIFLKISRSVSKKLSIFTILYERINRREVSVRTMSISAALFRSYPIPSEDLPLSSEKVKKQRASRRCQQGVLVLRHRGHRLKIRSACRSEHRRCRVSAPAGTAEEYLHPTLRSAEEQLGNPSRT